MRGSLCVTRLQLFLLLGLSGCAAVAAPGGTAPRAVWSVAYPHQPYESRSTVSGVIVLNESAADLDKRAVCEGLIHGMSRLTAGTANARVTYWLYKGTEQQQTTSMTCGRLIDSYDYPRSQQLLAVLQSRGVTLPLTGYVALLIILDGPDRFALVFTIPRGATAPVIASTVVAFRSQIVQSDQLREIAQNGRGRTASAELGAVGPPSSTTGEGPSFWTTWVAPILEAALVELAKDGLRAGVTLVFAAL